MNEKIFRPKDKYPADDKVNPDVKATDAKYRPKDNLPQAEPDPIMPDPNVLPIVPASENRVDVGYLNAQGKWVSEMEDADVKESGWPKLSPVEKEQLKEEPTVPLTGQDYQDRLKQRLDEQVKHEQLKQPGEMPKKAVSKETVNHPAHYNMGQYEVIDVITDWGLGFSLGNAVKYIARAGIKDPSKKAEDLRKAIFYINYEIQQLEKGKTKC